MCQDISHQENKCCSTMPFLERAKQRMVEHAQLVEEACQVTSPSPSAEEMELCSGFAIETLAAFVGQPPAEEQASQQKSPTQEVQSAGGLLERLRRYLKSKPLTYIPGMQSPHHLRQEQDSAGTQRRIGSSCQCEMYKGKSLG